MLRLKQFRDEAKGLSDLLNFACIPADGIVMGKDGSLMAGWYYAGDDVDSVAPSELNALSARINAAFSKLGNGWMLQTDAIRRSVETYPMPEGAFPDPITQRIDDERRQLFGQKGMQFETVHALVVTYLPPMAAESRLYSFLVDDPSAAETKNLASKHLGYFEQCLAGIEMDLSSVLRLSRMRGESVLGQDGQMVVFDQLLQYINHTITGKNHPIRLPSCPMYIDAILGAEDLVGGLKPKIGERHISVLSIDGFPQDGEPAILRQLANLGCEYRWHTRFIFMDRQQSRAELESYRKKWKQKVRGFRDQIFQTHSGRVDEHALMNVREVDEALALIESGVVAFGFYTSVIVLLNEDQTKLEEDAKEVVRTISDIGFSCRKETINAIEAWLGSLPSHASQNVRRPIMHTLNLADLLPMTSVWPGERFNPSPHFPPRSPPLFQAFTGGNTAFRGNLHVGDLGHFIIVGPPGSGKSLLLAFLNAQFRRYPGAKVFAFDKGFSQFALAQGVDGLHYDIAGEEGARIRFCPLANIDKSEAERAWAKAWISNACEYQGFKIEPHHRGAIHDAIELLKSSHSKTLTDFAATLQDRELRDVIKHFTLDGAMGILLDGEEDDLKLSDFQVFEIESLMNLGDKNALPVLEYIFHRIETSLDGSPAILPIDEAWLALQHPAFREKIREWLKVMRKNNVAVGLATQSISDAAQSGILDVIAETCQTKIFGANPSAGDDSSSRFYKALGINDKQIRIISSLTPKRDYYIVQPHGKRVIELGVGALAMRWLGVSSKEAVKSLRKLIADRPSDWKTIWERSS